MKTNIEFYIPIEKLTEYNRGRVVVYTAIPAHGLIKIVTAPYSIIFVNKTGNIYYIRKAKFKERMRLKFRRKLK